MTPAVFATHLEEAQFLFAERQEILRSAEFTAVELADLDTRLAAHLDGLTLAGDAELELLQERLVSDEVDVVSTATTVLLRLRSTEAAGIVLRALAAATGGQLTGICQALCHGPIDSILFDLQRMLEKASSSVAASIALALAWQNQSGLQVTRLRALLDDPDPTVRQLSWRTAALLTPSHAQQLLNS